jgi:DNA gyrase subunit A
MVRQIDIESEMQQSYLDYAMSVIVARALPDARDGLKPVHRRILFAMHAMGIRPDTDLKKSARIVGEVLGKYHPHGDMAVYDAMVRMAQDFSMRYPLIDGQGNFGSIDGDPPAAMRYTEARLAPMAMDLLATIERDTVDFTSNFDSTLEEPVVLPTSIPNLLVNGSTGIAVGMATSIPPHNMTEVCDALTYVLENWSHLDKVGVEDLMGHIHGPDFPTGGIIVHSLDDREGLSAAYATGRGRITVQAKAHLEDMGRGRTRIIVTELPFQTNKSSLIERIAELARTGGMDGLADLRDESDRQGLRIVIELTKAAEPEKVLAELYRRTPMQTVFGINMLALVDGEPRLLSLKQALRVYLEHRLEVVRRRSEHDLARAREREHILAGYRIAIAHLDEVIQMIRSSQDTDQARQRLMKRFKLSDMQARAILDLPLKRLSTLERRKIDQEHKEVAAAIKVLEALLASDRKMREAVGAEIAEIRSRYGDRRRTQIAQMKKGKGARAMLTATDLAPDKDTWVVVTTSGIISRTPSGRLPRLSGKETPAVILGASARDLVYLFDTRGNGAAVPVHVLPECDDPKDGNPVVGATPFPPGSSIAAGIVLPAGAPSGEGAGFVFLISRSSMLKKTPIGSLPGPSSRPFPAMKVAENDALGWVLHTSGEEEILLASSSGFVIRFPESDVRPVGWSAAGVLGMRLDDERGAYLVAADLAAREADLLLLAGSGMGKRVELKQFPTQRRYGKGVLGMKTDASLQVAGAAVGFAEDRVVAHLGKGNDRSLQFSDAPRRSRAASGKSLVEVKSGDRVIAVTPVVPRPARPTPPAAESASGRAPSRAAGKRSRAGAKAKHAGAGSRKRGASKAKPAGRRPAAKTAGKKTAGKKNAKKK